MAADGDMKVIYDLGANNGDDLAYYLLKADRVVAVEANPQLADLIRQRYAAAIAEDRLRVENCVLVAGEGGEPVPFYIHKRSHLASQFPTPSADTSIAVDYASDPAHYDRVELPSLGVRDLIARHGAPWYMKLDLESYDAEVLRALFANGIFPPLISAESHSIEVLATMVALGGYSCFNLVDGSQVGRDFADHPITTRNGPGRFRFPDHAAGPFGDDLPGPWRDTNAFFRFLALRGLGWKDVHASRIHTPELTEAETLPDFIVNDRTHPALRAVMRGVLDLARRIAVRPAPWPHSRTDQPTD